MQTRTGATARPRIGWAKARLISGDAVEEALRIDGPHGPTTRATTAPTAQGQGLLRDATQPASEDNAKQDKLDALAVPSAHAIAGTPGRETFDRASRTHELSFRSIAVPGVRLASGAPTKISCRPGCTPTATSRSSTTCVSNPVRMRTG